MWEPIDYDTVWGRFDDVFGFDRDTSSVIVEPAGSITYDLAPCVNGDGTGEWARHAINFTVVWALAEITPPESPILALDWQHPAYEFWPRRSSTVHPGEMLSESHITPFPNGDYFAFLSENFRTGTFGHPWESSLCVFGDRLLERVDPLLSTMLPIKRRN